ncbi:putative integrator complex subunit 2 [Apostichopus japonicus]|uniref:Putative integrator complex subunit 2 n=1 Tax=Stichopus japonicus TaxID=307972 RepID=A0A2G8LLM8_STIJA|nr:putative integrator complex subunit 2 [Apostichopus japonicus]
MMLSFGSRKQLLSSSNWSNVALNGSMGSYSPFPDEVPSALCWIAEMMSTYHGSGAKHSPSIPSCFQSIPCVSPASEPAIGVKSDPGNTRALPSDPEREELKGALIAAQEAAATQILLEVCLPFEKEQVSDNDLNALREVRCQVCSVLHQMFIADPGLAKLVHFQGYPSELLAVTVAGIPSMHICLDFIPELLGQPQLSKQIFAIQLTSQLCLQFALPKSLSVARLAVNFMSTLLSVLSGVRWVEFYNATTPCLANICTAFPPMYDDSTSLLIQIGRIAHSRLASTGKRPHLVLSSHCSMAQKHLLEGVSVSKDTSQDQALIALVEGTFASIVKNASFTRGVA